MTAGLMALVSALLGREKPTVSVDAGGPGGDATVAVIVDRRTGTVKELFLRCPYCRTFCKDTGEKVCPKCGSSFYPEERSNGNTPAV